MYLLYELRVGEVFVKTFVSETFLIKEWDFGKNNEDPKEVLFHSHKEVWWRCIECGHNWKASVKARSYGKKSCKQCASLATKKPDIAAQWHPALNGALTPRDVVYGSRSSAWWLCNKCGNEWSAAINNRTKPNGSGCPYCDGKKVCDDNCLATLRPDVAAQWHSTLNGDLTPNDFTCGSGKKKIWWLCQKCKHVWKSRISDRSNGHGCPKCSNKPVSRISKQWLDSLNISVENREHYFKDLGFRVDAFVPETNTVYEFFGDYWHGNPKRFNKKKVHPFIDKTFGELYDETKARISRLEEAGYKVVYVWENDYKDKVKNEF